MQSIMPLVSGMVFSPLAHHDYGEVDPLCLCIICVDWRNKLYFYHQTLLTTPHGPEERDDRGCLCSDACKASMKARSAYLGALHRRNLYCESSWHAASMNPKELGESYMKWVQGELTDRESRSDSWWERQGSCFPMAYWLTMFRQSFNEVVSGAVSAAVESLPKSRMDMVFSTVAVSGAI